MTVADLKKVILFANSCSIDREGVGLVYWCKGNVENKEEQELLDMLRQVLEEQFGGD